MKMKKLLAVLLAALMMLTLFAGCSDKSGNDSKKDDTSKSENVNEDEETTKPIDSDNHVPSCNHHLKQNNRSPALCSFLVNPTS